MLRSHPAYIIENYIRNAFTGSNPYTKPEYTVKHRSAQTGSEYAGNGLKKHGRHLKQILSAINSKKPVHIPALITEQIIRKKRIFYPENILRIFRILTGKQQAGI